MRVFLDDLRPTPVGWDRTYTVEETIELLKTRTVSHLSLDNDLGIGLKEGYIVMDWLEEMSYFDNTFPIPEINIHSSNAARKQYMQLVNMRIRERLSQ